MEPVMSYDSDELEDLDVQNLSDDGEDRQIHEENRSQPIGSVKGSPEDPTKKKTDSPIISLGASKTPPHFNSISKIQKPPFSTTLPKNNTTNHALSGSPLKCTSQLNLSPSKTILPSLENIKISPSKPPLSPQSQKAHNCSPSRSKKYTNYPYYNPIISPKQTKSPLKPHSSSSSISGPSIPPGFENFIPSPLKELNERKKLKKAQKKKNKQDLSPELNKPIPNLPLSPSHKRNLHDDTATEIIELGLQLGMNFNGSLTELHEKIKDILCRQEAEWRSV